MHNVINSAESEYLEIILIQLDGPKIFVLYAQMLWLHISFHSRLALPCMPLDRLIDWF